MTRISLNPRDGSVQTQHFAITNRGRGISLRATLVAPETGTWKVDGAYANGEPVIFGLPISRPNAAGIREWDKVAAFSSDAEGVQVLLREQFGLVIR